MPIRNLQYYAVTVPDLELGKKFYTDFGLELVTETNDKLVFRCFGRDQDQLFLLKGEKRKFHHICFGCAEEDLEGITQRLSDMEIEFVEPTSGFSSEGLWFKDFEGMLTRIIVANEAPVREGKVAIYNDPNNKERIAERTELANDPAVLPRRLGHIVLFTTDPDKKVEFYSSAFDMKVSDSIKDFLRFMYCSTGSDHHIVAVAKSAGLGIQHVGFEVENADEAAMGGRQMADKGYITTWGPGRHGPGSNAFFYLRDPWSSMVEYFADMDYIPANADWKSENWADKASTIVWGTKEPSDFPTNFELLVGPPKR